MTRAPLADTRIIVPVRNGGVRWREAAAALRAAAGDPSLVVVVDSASSDGSDQVAAQQGFTVVRIDPRTFNHGRTRQEAVQSFCADTRFVMFLTQDAVVVGRESLTRLVDSFHDERVAAAYGRQLPHLHAGAFEAHATCFNYLPVSETRTLADAPRLGIKTAFFSNSFAAYRVDALLQCGGFPHHLILGEDAYVAMKFLLSGWKLRYCAEAEVRHSHAYSIAQEMQRYFDFGVMHAQMPELLRHFGAPEGEGARFVLSELRFVGARAPTMLAQVPVRNAAKYLGYRLGRAFTTLPVGLRRRLSMTKGYWDSAHVSS